MRAPVVVILLLVMLLAAAPAHAQTDPVVETSLSSRTTFVGAPVEFTIFIRGSKEVPPPALPEIENGVVQGRPGSRRSSFFNGRTSVVESTYTYSIAPIAPGTMLIPAFTITVEGRRFASEPMKVQVRRDTEEKIVLEVSAAEETVYLGEPIDLTLDVFIRAFTDEALGHALTEGDLWGLVDHRRSEWGDFTSALEELAGQRQRPRGQMVERTAADGEPYDAWRYRVKATVWPSQAGPIQIADVVATVTYPLRLGRSRGLLNRGRLVIESSRPASARAASPDVRVLPVPTAGRPPWFSGAVGDFDLVVTAAPLDVAVGDPITLTMELVPASPRSTKLELVAPPALDEVRELVEDFRLPADQPLAGVVSGGMKRFTQTIRARRDTVTEIAAIPFASFVPETGTFETVWSEPIPITVRAGSQVDASDVVGAPVASPQPSANTGLTDIASGLQANYADASLLLATQTPGLRWWMGILIGLPPLAFGAAAIGARKRRRATERPDLVRLRKAGRRALKAVQAARSAEDAAEFIAAAMSAYVADRVHRPVGGMTRAEAVAAVTAAGLGPEIAQALDALLQHCEEAQYAGAAAESAAALAGEAEGLIRRMGRAKWLF